MSNPIRSSKEEKSPNLDSPQPSSFGEATADPAGSKSSISTSLLMYYFRLEIGSKIFDQRLGEIVGRPFVSSNSQQHDLANIIIDDPDDSVRSTIDDGEEDVKVFVGFDGDEEYEIMSGKISRIGRKLPDGLELEITDYSSQSKSSIPRVVDAKTGETLDSPATASESTEATELEKYSDLNAKSEKRVDVGSAVADKLLEYESKSKITTDKAGEAILGESVIGAAVREAEEVGDVTIASGKTVRRIPPEGDGDSGIVLDWVEQRSVFIGNPTIGKFTANQGRGSGGTWRVEGWNIDQKTTQGAVVVVPKKLDYDLDRTVEILGVETRLGEPIFEDCLFFWGDATLGGERLPSNSKVKTRIVAIARTLDKLNRELEPNKKWEIISWYNPDGDNRHQLGDAADFVPADLARVYAYLDESWSGGLGLYPDRFIHLDKRQDDGAIKIRFEY